MISEWRPIETAPKDGTLIRIGWSYGDDKEMEEYFIMQWGHIQKNELFPGKVGMWVSPSGELTWNDDGEDAPTHWQPYNPPRTKNYKCDRTKGHNRMSLTVNGMTLEQIKAELCKRVGRTVAREAGVHYLTVSRIKTGASPNPRIESLDALSRYFIANPIKGDM